MEIAQRQFSRPRKPRTRNKYLPKINCDDMVTEDVSFYNDQIKVTVTKSAGIVNNWIHETRLIYGLRRLIIGLDVEWLPNLNDGEDHPVATLQLCIDRRCLIFQLLHRDSMPAYLSSFLMNPNNWFAGVGVDDDAHKLLLHHGLHVSTTLDLNLMACQAFQNQEFRRIGLKRMAKAVLRKDMAKPQNITLSKWDAEVLCFQQIEYAAIDAFVSSELAKLLYYSLAVGSLYYR